MPRRMLRRGRPVDPSFSLREKLYFRCKCDAVMDGGRIKPKQVPFPDQSVNRQRYSKARDVLLPLSTGAEHSRKWLFWGVAMIRVRDVPGAALDGSQVEHVFRVEHDPLDENYGHSEIRVYKQGVHMREKREIDDLVKKEYRTNLALRARVVVQPLT